MDDETRLASAGRAPRDFHGAVNVPVYHASTILYPSLDALEAMHLRREEDDSRDVTYGRSGTPTSYAFEDAVAELEGGYRTLSFPSGLAAIGAALLAFLKAGDHLLVSDSVYAPTRAFCDHVLRRFGVETTYYDPLIGAGIAALMRPDTAAVFVESPGSVTFEVQDVPAIAAVAHDRGALVLMDNTWASPLYFKPFEHGVDVAIQAATKYIVGHSDAMLGTVTASKAVWPKLRRSVRAQGLCAGPDDLYLGLRGLRTLAVRLARHQETGLVLARWLKLRPEVARVLHPALPDDPGHALWQRDFRGASGLFAIELKPVPRAALALMLDGLEHFGMGYSWGGYESLIVPQHPEKIRTIRPWTAAGPLLRIHAGLESPEDLIADLERGFARLGQAR